MISDSYQSQLARIHEAHASWGASAPFTAWTQQAARACNAGLVLDYGCGKGAHVAAARAAGLNVAGYDPGVPAFNVRPPQAGLLVSYDVLEHVEPECLDATLREIAALSANALLAIGLRPAACELPDGRNAHLSLLPPHEWVRRLREHFSSVAVLHRTLCHVVLWCTNAGVSFVPRGRTGPDSIVTALRSGGRRFLLRDDTVLSLHDALPEFTDAEWVDGARVAILAGTHPALPDDLRAVTRRYPSAPVMALHKAAPVVGGAAVQLCCDRPDSNAPEANAWAGKRIARWRHRSQPAYRSAMFMELQREWYVEPDDPEFPDWLHLPWVYFKGSFPTAIQILYACGIRRIVCAGVRLVPTAESSEHQRDVYARQRAFMAAQAAYFAACGLVIEWGEQ